MIIKLSLAVILFVLFAFTPTRQDVYESRIDLKSKQTLYTEDINALFSLELRVALSLHKGKQEAKTKAESAALAPCVAVEEELASKTNQPIVALQGWRIKFSGSPQSYTICYPSSSHSDLDYATMHFALLPMSLRTHVQTVLLLPTNYSPFTLDSSASSSKLGPHGMYSPQSSMATLFGRPSIGTWIHEFAHALDADHGVTRETRWREALMNDSCVADPYSKTSVEEAFSQAMLLRLYLLLHPQARPENISCMQHQMAAMEWFNPAQTLLPDMYSRASQDQGIFNLTLESRNPRLTSDNAHFND